jgi:hypothetical protein
MTEMEWLIPLIAGATAVLMLVLSKPEKPVLAWLAGFLILLTAAWQGYSAYQEMLTKEEIHSHA